MKKKSGDDDDDMNGIIFIQHNLYICSSALIKCGYYKHKFTLRSLSRRRIFFLPICLHNIPRCGTVRVGSGSGLVIFFCMHPTANEIHILYRARIVAPAACSKIQWCTDDDR